ncbi:MAG: UvrD-helicase domain-containing protein [Chlamydiales bacterium]|nr:UvrD-helicase domain-containing protein [Chlamydiales bacterium]
MSESLIEKGLAKLNPEQQKAVYTTEGRVLILAGAGSGKTSVLAWRIAYLILSRHVSPKNILGLTFTNKAAQEMRERVGGIIGKQAAKEVTLSTFHSFCAQVLRQEIHHLGYTKEFSLYDEQDVRRLLRQLVRVELDHEGELPGLDGTIDKISWAKSRSFTSEELSDPLTKKLFERLQVCMRAYNAVDFDSLLSLTVQLFEEFPAVLKRYQERFLYILIDEYQDTNPIQYRLAELLARGHDNLCVVGDDDQSIYGWRGAELKNILEFTPKTTIKLEQNYRSTPTILKAAHALIAHNSQRLGKELWSTKEVGDPIALFHAPTEIEESQAVVERLIWFNRHKGVAWKDMAILYRSNTQVRPLEAALMQGAWQREGQWVRGVPYHVFGGTEFYERSEIKDLLAYLRVIHNPHDQEALLRIINVPRRGVSDQALDLLTQNNRKANIPLWQLLTELDRSLDLQEQLSDRAKKGIASFLGIIKKAQTNFATQPLSSALEALIEEIDYKKAISEEVKSEKMREFKWENVTYCVEEMKNYEEEMTHQNLDSEISLHNFLTTTLLNGEKSERREKEFKENRVNLMTFHGAKGLEFEVCFLVGLEDHLIPHEKSIGTRGIEEERRLLYVAMTRAKKHLTLTMARSRKRMGKESNSTPSRFLNEIPKDLLKISSWKKPD